MNHIKKWEVTSNFQFSIFNFQKDPKKEIQKLLGILLENRGLATKKERLAFLHPDIATVTPDSVDIDKKNLVKTISRIQKAITNKEQIVVFGDYDVDGIAGTAIMWEALNALGATVTPYIPSRIEEGYGLSSKGISNIQSHIPNVKVIITVDNGIVANEAVDYANSLGIDVILTDHHTVGEKLPSAYAIVHTTKLCGTGVAYMLSKEISNKYQLLDDHLALVALATVADLVPLTNANRVLLLEGLKVLHVTKRPGIVAICEEAGVDQSKIGVYEIGHMIAPRLNAMGRIASAMDSLRLLCTKDGMRAKALAEKLGITNKERQDLTKNLSEHAMRVASDKKENLLFVAHSSYDEGIIGLVAGKLVETYYRPAIVISLGEKVSKASARSISGFNIIEFIRSAKHLLINAGGHPMAAGFTVETVNIESLQNFLLKNVDAFLSEGMLTRFLKIDCELPLQVISQEVYGALQQLQPFGMGNPEQSFLSKDVIISDIKAVGRESNHLKLELRSKDNELRIQGIAFGLGERVKEFKVGQEVQIVYTIDENEWNNKKTLQLKIKDIKK